MKVLLTSAAALLVTMSVASAGHEVADVKASKEVVSEFPFEKGAHEVQALAGSFFSFTHSPSLHYAVGTLRYGWMLSTADGSGFFRGNTEFLVEAFGGGIFEGPGSVLAGATLLLRYNFVQPEARWVPYVQIGAGGLYSDAADDEDQRLIGTDFSFNLQGSLGIRYMFSDRCALTLEAGYRHISNAGIADRNTGVDSVGGQIGMSWFY